jgi:hypothetical protein
MTRPPTGVRKDPGRCADHCGRGLGSLYVFPHSCVDGTELPYCRRICARVCKKKKLCDARWSTIDSVPHGTRARAVGLGALEAPALNLRQLRRRRPPSRGRLRTGLGLGRSAHFPQFIPRAGPLRGERGEEGLSARAYLAEGRAAVTTVATIGCLSHGIYHTQQGGTRQYGKLTESNNKQQQLELLDPLQG